ncbi:MAG TPA: hypothetical protein VK075_04855 [Pseudogracilibacillus sp.]|nr:hypothetical protein [Pseudogracilibacillus sp.]
MKRSEKDQFIIDQYENDEKMMVLIYAQWCVNNEINPIDLYQEAYPNQLISSVLHEMVDETMPKEEADFISNDIVLSVLQMFGNDDLAFEVQRKIEEMDQ